MWASNLHCKGIAGNTSRALYAVANSTKVTNSIARNGSSSFNVYRLFLLPQATCIFTYLRQFY